MPIILFLACVARVGWRRILRQTGGVPRNQHRPPDIPAGIHRPHVGKVPPVGSGHDGPCLQCSGRLQKVGEGPAVARPLVWPKESRGVHRGGPVQLLPAEFGQESGNPVAVVRLETRQHLRHGDGRDQRESPPVTASASHATTASRPRSQSITTVLGFAASPTSPCPNSRSATVGLAGQTLTFELQGDAVWSVQPFATAPNVMRLSYGGNICRRQLRTGVESHTVWPREFHAP